MKNLKKVTCNNMSNPIGIDIEPVYFSWQIYSDQNNIYQKSYHIIVRNECDSIVWDSGRVQSGNTLFIQYEGDALQQKTTYYYEISVEDNKGEVLNSSIHSFETGISSGGWKADWIGRQIPADKEAGPDPDADYGKILVDMMQGKDVAFKSDRKLEPCNEFCKEVVLAKDKKLAKARIYMTAHGVYQLKVNGEMPDDRRLAPGFTKYEEYLEYQTYDVTDMLYGGKNQISIILADGWFKGKFGMLGLGESYGDELAFLLEMEITYKDGTKERIVSDDSFMYAKSSWCYADILIGAKYDARLEAGERRWLPAEKKEISYQQLAGTAMEPVRPVEVLKPTAVLTSPKGEKILDFGQNIVGVVKLKVSGAAGTEIMLEHAEVLQKDGTFENFIDGFNRDQTDYYILKGDFEEVWQPEFTFHGFRYVKVSGYPGELDADNFHAVVIGSDCEITNYFKTSNSQLNQLQSNIMWSQRGNLLSIPTDCPQRERAGWTGDVWVYGETCCVNQNCLNFFKVWLRNLRKEQFEDGLVPIVVPYIKAYSGIQLSAFGTHTSAGWGDVIVALPWYLYQIYGDRSVLEENYQAMEKWMAYVRNEAETGVNLQEGADEEAAKRQRYLWNTNFHFGDWLYPSCKKPNGEADMFASAMTTKEQIATAIYANSTDVMAQICRVIGKNERSQYYADLNRHIREAFDAEYVNEEGLLGNDLQGLYIMALAMNMTVKEKRPRLARRLQELVDANNGCLDAGFMSIKFLMDVLVDNDFVETANTILYQQECPSWLYEVNKGATTIWETWNSIREDDTRGRFSYNHYAFGCIGDWMYRNLLGIQRLEPGYRKVMIAPDLRFGLKAAEGAFSSAAGMIEVKWRRTAGEKLELRVRIPANITAFVKLPDREIIEIGNGTYHFCS